MLASNVILDAAQRGGEPTATAEVITEPIQRFVFSGTGTADTLLDAVDLAALPERAGDSPRRHPRIVSRPDGRSRWRSWRPRSQDSSVSIPTSVRR